LNCSTRNSTKVLKSLFVLGIVIIDGFAKTLIITMLRTLQCFGGVFCCAVQIEQHALKNVNDCGVIRNCVNFESIKVAEKTGIHSAI
jgi:hypothetical protein